MEEGGWGEGRGGGSITTPYQSELIEMIQREPRNQRVYFALDFVTGRDRLNDLLQCLNSRH